MPTKLDRVQVLFQKNLFKKLKIISNIERRSLSSMVSSMVEDAIQSKKYQSILSKAKAGDLQIRIDKIDLLVKEILKSQSSKEINFAQNFKLKQIEETLSVISESNKESLEEPLEDNLVEENLLLVDKVLKPDDLIEELQLEADYKLNKMKVMLNKIKENKDLND